MISTETTVRAEVVAALQADYADFGFQSSSAIKDYLFADHQVIEPQAYLYNLVSGKTERQLHAVGVEVVTTGEDININFGTDVERRYLITIEIYRSIGLNGEGKKGIIDDRRQAIKAVRDRGDKLNGTVDMILEVESDAVVRRKAPEGLDDDEMFIQRISVAARKNPADF